MARFCQQLGKQLLIFDENSARALIALFLDAMPSIEDINTKETENDWIEEWRELIFFIWKLCSILTKVENIVVFMKTVRKSLDQINHYTQFQHQLVLYWGSVLEKKDIGKTCNKLSLILLKQFSWRSKYK